MEIINVKKYSIYSGNSFVLKLNHIKNLVLFNCFEGLQSYVINKNLKMNNLSKIIITDLNINNISGLLGLLSSLNSIGRIKALHIYGPQGLAYYLDLGKKYSHTNFKYIVYIHILSSCLVINHDKYRIYTYLKNNCFEFFIIASEKEGTFIKKYANNYNLHASPLYSYLKKGNYFILPDGVILDGQNFTTQNVSGKTFAFISNRFYDVKFIQNTFQSVILINETC